MKKFTYKDCGCSFDITKVGPERPSIVFDLDIENINLDCKKTWQIISDGNTKGCFQLESRLGQSLAKKLKPENIEQLAALVSIMRPGCLEAFREGKSVTHHYIDKKNHLESIDYFHSSLEPILNKTYGEMIYQEQAMQIAQKIAGFDLKEADMLRKAIGKKKPEEMAKVKQMFLEGSKKLKTVNEPEANELFNWIEKSQRYSFNKSHAVSYAFNAYLSAYAKAHFPKIFFTSYLMFAKDKIDPQKEIRELVNNAIEMDISIKVPDLRLLNKNFILKENIVYFGLTNIKGFGDSMYDKLMVIIKENNYEISNMTFIELCFNVLIKLNSTAAKSLICSGSLDFLKMNRNYMMAIYNAVSGFTDRERSWIISNLKLAEFKNLQDVLEFILTCEVGKKSCIASAKRLVVVKDIYNILKHPPYSLIDTPEWIADNEHSLLGTSITCSKIDGCDILNANTTCKEFKNTNRKEIVIACELQDINIIKTKKGKNPGQEMSFISISDSTGGMDCVVCFPEQHLEYNHLLDSGNTVLIAGSKNKEGTSLIIKKMWQL
jgi:DNA polymerase III alpha subunit